MVFVVHYLDVKFKVETGSAKRQTKEDKKKDKAKPRDSVLFSFSYNTLVQVTNGYLDQVLEYVRKKHPLALPVGELISSQFQDYFGFYLFLTCNNFAIGIIFFEVFACQK